MRTQLPTGKACVGCGDRFSPTLLPFDAPEDDGDGRGKIERWCPQCFCGVRALRDARWADAVRLGHMCAVRCDACGVTSVSVGDLGRKFCPQCRSPRVTVLLPKDAILRVADVRRAGYRMARA